MPHTQHRYEHARESERPRLRIASALRAAISGGYGARDLRADVMAGIVVGVVALPLSMALAIASGVPPQYGIYTAIVAGAVIAALGGSPVNVSGPTAAFVVLLAPIATSHGLGGLVMASLLAGAILVLMGLLRLGRLIQFIPHPVTTGFTAGIAVVIATLQLKDFLGLDVRAPGDHYVERVAALARAAGTIRWPEVIVGSATLAILFLWPRVTKRVPGPLIAVVAATGLAALLASAGHEIATIGSRFTFALPDGATGRGIPSLPPAFVLPWRLPGPGGAPLRLDFETLQDLIQPALAIAMLGAIESLLCAVVADSMGGTRHDPDVELIAQGAGNLVAPFFGGFAATGAIARTATSIRSGGRTPVASIVHAAFVLVAVLSLGKALGHLPMAALAALLLYVAWNMSDVPHFVHILRVAPKSDSLVLVTCFALTVLFDMVIAVGVGVGLAALLFMGRMAEIATTRFVQQGETARLPSIPSDVLVFEIAGPLFFGAAEKAVSTLNRVSVSARAAILHIGAVPVMDVTGLVALETAIKRLNARGLLVVLAGIQPQPAKVLARAGLADAPGSLVLCRTLEDAIAVVGTTPAAAPTPAPGPA